MKTVIRWKAACYSLAAAVLLLGSSLVEKFFGPRGDRKSTRLNSSH